MKYQLKFRIFVLATFLAVVTSSCKISTVPLQTTRALPSSYGLFAINTADTSQVSWHQFYQDSVLRDLIETALTHNLDVIATSEEVHLAVAGVKMVQKNFLPAVDLSIANSTRKFGEHTMDDIGNKDTNKSDDVPPGKRIPSPYSEWFSGVVFQWEADIWGKLASQRKAAANRYLASAEFYRVVATKLVSDIATTYFELMGLDQEKKVLQENLRLQELGFELIQIQKAGGKVNQLAVDQFEAQLLDIKNRIVQAERKIIVAEARINELLGRFPQPIARDSVSDYPQLRLPPVGKPEQLLKRRPDIRQAELRLTEAHWNVNAARAAFYPSLKLSGTAGLSSFEASKLFNIPGSTAFSLAGGILTPLFQQNQIRAQYAAAGSKQKIALANYEKTLVESYHEVYTTFAWINTVNKQIELKNAEVAVLRRAFGNSNDLFSVGYATYLEVIMAQRRMLETELELTRLRKDELKSRAVLYRALGGGWQ